MSVWDKFWMCVLGAIFSCSLYLIVNFSLSEKRTLRYEMGASDGFGNITIVKVIDNSNDELIRLSVGVSYEQAVKLLDSLNNNLRKYPYDYSKK